MTRIKRVKNENGDDCKWCELNSHCTDVSCEDGYYFVFAEKLEFEIVEETLEDICPDCGSKMTDRWSGIKCNECGYWFCY